MQPSDSKTRRWALTVCFHFGIEGQALEVRAPGDFCAVKIAVERRGEAAAGFVNGDGRTRVGAGDGGEEEGEIVDGAGERAFDAERRPSERRGPDGDASGRGAEADNIAEARWIAERTTDVGAIRDGQHTARERDRRATARAAAGFGGLVGVERRAEDVVEGLRASAELGHVGLAEGDGAGVVDALDEEGVGGGHEIFEDARAERGADSAGEQQVLVGDGQAVQGAGGMTLGDAVRERFVEFAGAMGGVVAGERDDGVDRGVDAVDLGEVGGEGFAGREVLGADAAGHFAGWEEADVGDRLWARLHERVATPASGRSRNQSSGSSEPLDAP